MVEQIPAGAIILSADDLAEILVSGNYSDYDPAEDDPEFNLMMVQAVRRGGLIAVKLANGKLAFKQND